MDNKKVPNLTPEKNYKFACKYCDYSTCRHSQWDRHILTRKHINNEKRNLLVPLVPHDNTIPMHIEIHKCGCGRAYKYISGLCKHQKNCSILNKSTETQLVNKTNTNDLLEIILNENTELKKILNQQQKQIGELIPKIGNITNNTTNKFNLNVFLNTECKDAISIMDFAKSLEVHTQDLENTGKNGYITGLTQIILKGLSELDLHKRPIHCSDLKREVLYVKDDKEWAKDNEDREMMKKAIKYIRRSNIKQIPKWVDENPDCTDSGGSKNDLYMNIIQNSMGHVEERTEDKNMNKIIKNVAASVTIDKMIENK